MKKCIVLLMLAVPAFIFAQEEALVTAVTNGDTAFVKSYKGDADAADTNGMTPLMWAAARGQTDIIKVLIRDRASLKTADKVEGKTALLWAAVRGQSDALRELIKDGADVNAVDNDGRTPLIYAAIHGDISMVKGLVGAKRFFLFMKVKINIRDKDGNTALSHAQEVGDPEITDLLKKSGAK